MKLYHGSNIEVKEPKILESDRKLDFGNGFYLTSSYEQAKKWAILTSKRRKEGQPIVSVFNFGETNDLKILTFDKADIEWLRFISSNRKNIPLENDFDIIKGPVANDKTMPVITLFFLGVYSEEETIKRLLPQKLQDQIVFKTEHALKFLKFKEALKPWKKFSLTF